MATNFYKINRGLKLEPQTQFGAGDPPGTDGEIYYNAILDKFRKFEAGAWTDMDTVGGGGGGAGYNAVSVSVSSGATSRVVTFATPMTDTAYIILAQFENTVDVSPMFQQVEITTKGLLGFTASWNMPLDSANYKLIYIVPSRAFIMGETPIPSGVNTVSIVPAMVQTNLNNGIMVQIQNLVDTFPQFHTAILTSGIIGSEHEAGMIYASGSTTVPNAALYCNGASYLRSDYPDLFAKIGTAFGAVDSLHFNVPDLRGEFLRGQNDGTGVDPNAGTRSALKPGGNIGDNIGSYQSDAFASHTHGVLVYENCLAFGCVSINAGCGAPYNGACYHTTTASGGSETRPINVNVRYYIKYTTGGAAGTPTIRWNTLTDSINYATAYVFKATGEKIIPNGTTSVTAALPFDYGNTNYSVVAMMQDKRDGTPLFQPIVITSKTSGAFTAQWSMPTDSNNYILSYYAISYTA